MLFYFLIGAALHDTHGLYKFVPLAVLTILFLIFVGMVFFHPSPRPLREFSMIRLLSWIYSAQTLILAMNPAIIHSHQGPWSQALQGVLFLNAVFSMILVSRVGRGGTGSWIRASWILWVLAHALVLKASPNPHIDVFTINRDAAIHISEGRNPYSQEYEDIYDGAYDYKPGFTYWPAILAWILPAQWLFGDIRWGMLAAILLSTLGLRRLLLRASGPRGPPKDFLEFSSLIWISFPVSLFVLEQAWVDSALLAWGTVSMLAVLKKRWIGAGICLGILCATKQYGFLMAVLTGFFVLFTEGWRPVLRMTLTAIGTSALWILPFAWNDWTGFYQKTIDILISISSRRDALTWVAFVSRKWGVGVPGMVTAVAYLGTLVGVVLWMKTRPSLRISHWSASIVILFGVLFFLGKQAFCNYYYFLAFFVWLHAMTSWLEAKRE